MNEQLGRMPEEMRTRARGFGEQADSITELLRDFHAAVDGAVTAAGDDDPGLAFGKPFQQFADNVAAKIQRLEKLLSDTETKVHNVADTTQEQDTITAQTLPQSG